MKKLFNLLLCLFVGTQLYAQAPQRISYQAVIRNNSNNLLPSTPVKIRISILQGDAAGTEVFSEIHSATTNANGLVSLEIGGGGSQTGNFTNINWGNNTYFLKTQTDPNNGTNYTITGTTQILSVPYALEANNAKNAAQAKKADTALVSLNGFKALSKTGDSLQFENGKWIIIPGINDANTAHFNPDLTYGNLTDIEGNTYRTIIIGTQEWMAENLRVKKYKNGSNITGTQDIYRWRDNATGAWCYYNWDPAENKLYGNLYNWYAVSKADGLCPAGWHVPSDPEWEVLKSFLGGGVNAGGKMKTTGTIQLGTGLWNVQNLSATNSSGFSATPAGFGNEVASYTNRGDAAIFWTSTTNGLTEAWGNQLNAAATSTSKASVLKNYALSVRCVKD